MVALYVQVEGKLHFQSRLYIILNYSRLFRESGRKPHNYRILTVHCFSSIK